MRATSLDHGLWTILKGLAAAVIAVILVVGGFIAGLELDRPILGMGLPILGAVLRTVRRTMVFGATRRSGRRPVRGEVADLLAPLRSQAAEQRRLASGVRPGLAGPCGA